tara:strand:- start:1774 stop:2178 length:405 start_codon:yes stop_codon:yes gene_type:complete
MKHKDITGEKEIKEVFNKKKYQDNEDTFYVIATGEHGDESEARLINYEDARAQFNLKASAMVETASKKDVTNSVKNKVGTMDLEAKRTVVSKAVQSYMIEEEGKLFYSEDRSTYIYRSVYKIEIDVIVNLLQSL